MTGRELPQPLPAIAPGDPFKPRLLVLHRRRVPQPILPVPYGYFLQVNHLPDNLPQLPLKDQLAEAKRALARRTFYRYDGPFGPVTGHEFRCAPGVSIFLDPEGDFEGQQTNPATAPAVAMRGSAETNPMTNKHPNNPRQFVVGRQEEGFYWFVAEAEDDKTDDPNGARRFAPLSAAVEASTEHHCNVFEVLIKDGKEKLRELMVDFLKIANAPFEGCYRVNDFLIAGPTYLTETAATSLSRIRALVKAKVTSVISLVSRGELFWMRRELNESHTDSLFQQNYFPIRDGAVPSRDTMRIILNAIDRTVDVSRVTFVHCVGGRGRTGAVIGCWLVRHRVATGPAALDALTELRFEHGLFKPSPETDAQRQLVIDWNEAE